MPLLIFAGLDFGWLLADVKIAGIGEVPGAAADVGALTVVVGALYLRHLLQHRV